jgi:hypothetical protein
MATCLVFTPDNPEVYTLNPSAWLILRLCDGRPVAEIAEAYHAAVEPMLSREQAQREVGLGIENLEQKRIIEVVNTRRAKCKPFAGRLPHESKA